MSTGSLPDRDQIAAYLLGKLSDDEADAVARRLEAHGDPESIVALEAECDSLVLALRNPAAPTNYEREPQCQRAIEAAELIADELVACSEPQAAAGDEHSTVLRDYQLLEKLGEGGMGAVYKAHHLRLKRFVAVKLLPTEKMSSPTAVARFQREMEAVGRVDHPNLVRALDAGEHNGRHYLAMEFVDGLDLSKLVKRIGPLPVADACEIARQTALALQHAHEHGLIHRDIKPSNIMLAPDGGVKILDLGLARLFDADVPADELTATGQVMGTADYMAPEQLGDSRHVDIRADIYSLGCTLFKLLTGQAPFSEPQFRTTFAKMKAHAEEPPRPVVDVRAEVPPELSQIVARMQAKQPDERYQTPAEVAAAVAAFAEGSDLPQLLQRAIDAEVDTPAEKKAPSTVHPISSAFTDTYVPGREEFAPEASSAPLAAPQQSRSPNRRKVALAALSVSALLAAAVVIYINTGHGELQITVNEPDFDVKVDGNSPPNVEISSEQDGTYLVSIKQVAAGRHLLEVTKDGFETHTEGVRIYRNGKKAVEAVLKPLLADNNRKTPDRPEGQASDGREIWQPDPNNPALPGLIPQPAKLPGIKRWQIETLAPRDRVTAVAYSPDGKLLAVGSWDHKVRIYDTATNRCVRVLLGHSNRVGSIQWNPDGRHLATLSKDELRIWGAEGVHKSEFPLTVGGSTNGLAWSPDGQQIAVASLADPLRICELESGKTRQLQTVFCHSVAWHPHEALILICRTDARIQTITEDGVLGEAWHGHEDARLVAWHPAGEKFASAGYDRKLCLWNRSGTIEAELTGFRSTQVRGLSWSADGTRIAGAGNDVRLWNADGTLIAEHDPGGYFISVDWRSGRDEVACGNWGGDVWMIPTAGTPQRVARGRDRSATSVAAHPDGSELAVTHSNGVQIWTANGGTLRTYRPPNNATHAAYSPNGTWLATVSLAPQELMLWDKDGQNGPTFSHPDYIYCVTWSPDNKLLATGESSDGKVRIWSVDGSAGPVLTHHTGRTRYVTWSPRGDRIASSGEDKLLCIWNANGQLVRGVETDAVCGISWSPEGRFLAACTSDGAAQIFTADGEVVRRIGRHEAPTSGTTAVSWSPGGRRILTASRGDSSLRCWDVSTGRLLAAMSFPFGDTDFSMEFSQDGKIFCVASANNELRVYNGRTLEPLWVGLHLNDEKVISFTAAGEIIHADPRTKEQLGYIVEVHTGEQKLFSHDEFYAYVKEAARQAETADREAQARQAELAPLAAQVAANTTDDPLDAEVTALRNKLVDFRIAHPYTTEAASAGRLMSQLPWPVDLLKREDIDAYELKAAGGGDASQAPPEVVGILGDSRLQHWNSITSLAFNSDASTLATVGADGVLNLWNVKTGDLVKQWRGANGQRFTAVAWSPDDRHLVVGAHFPLEVTVWNVEADEKLHSFRGDMERADCVAFTPDGRHIVSASTDASIRVWDAESGAFITMLDGHTAAVTGLSMSPDGKTLASTSEDKTVRFWNTATWTGFWEPIELSGPGRSVRFSRNGESIAFVDSKSLSLWSTATAEKLWETEYANYLVEFVADGQSLVTNSGGDTLELRSTADGSVSRQLVLDHPFFNSGAIGVCADVIALPSRPPTFVHLLNIENEDERLANGSVRSISFGPYGDMLASGDAEGGDMLASGDAEGKVTFHSVSNLVARTVIGSHQLPVLDVTFSPNGRRLTSVAGRMSSPAEMVIWDVSAERRIVSRTVSPSAPGVLLAYSSDGSRLVSTAADPTVTGTDVLHVWDSESGAEIGDFRGIPTARHAILDSKTDEVWACTGKSNDLYVFDATLSTERFRLQVPELPGRTEPRCLAWGPDARTLFAGSRGMLHEFDGLSYRYLRSAEVPALCISLSPDGTTLALGGNDGQVRLWDAATSRVTRTMRIGPPNGRIDEIQYTPDGRHIVTTNANGTAYVLRLQAYEPRAEEK